MAEIYPNAGTVYPNAGGQKEDFASPASVYVGECLQELYNWVNDTVFYSYSSPYLKPFYRKVQQWERWQNGVVPDFHNPDKGIIPTHLAKFIVDKVTNCIIGDGITLSTKGTEADQTVPNDTLKKVGEFAEKNCLNEKTATVARFAVGLGTGVFKLNKNDKGELWLECCPMNRMRYSYDANGMPTEASFQISVYFKNNGKNERTYGLFEKRRFYKGEPYSVYAMYEVNVPANNAPTPEPHHLSWKEIPSDIWEQFRHDHGTMKLDEPVRLPFNTLGVYPVKYTECLSSMPHLKYGDSVLEGINKYLCDYDILSGMLDTEMYCSRARAFVKKYIQNKSQLNANSGIDNFIFTEYESIGNNEAPLTFFQPDIRAEQMKTIRNTLLENIAVGIQISPSSLAPFLQDGEIKTAHEVSEEGKETALLVSKKRKPIESAINAMLDDVAGFLGCSDRVKAQFSLAGQSNYNVVVENTTRKYQAGLMSLDAAVRAVNPGMDEEQIAKEIQAIKDEAKEKNAQNNFSLFDNLDDGTEIMNG